MPSCIPGVVFNERPTEVVSDAEERAAARAIAAEGDYLCWPMEP